MESNIDVASQPAEYLTVQIGAKIRQIRKDNKLKLSDLAEESGISIAMLSKIENGRVFPKLPSLVQILKTLRVDLNDFFSDFKDSDAFPGYIFCKREQFQWIEKEDSVGFNYEHILSYPLARSSLEISLLTLEPDSKRSMVSTNGFEFIYLIDGSILYKLGKHTFEMKPGDALFFDGNIPHVPVNRINEKATVLVLYFINI